MVFFTLKKKIKKWNGYALNPAFFLCNEELLPALKSLMTYGALTYAGWHDPQATHDGAHITHNASDLIFKTGHPSGNYNQKLRKNTLNKISSNGDRTEVKSKVL